MKEMVVPAVDEIVEVSGGVSSLDQPQHLTQHLVHMRQSVTR